MEALYAGGGGHSGRGGREGIKHFENQVQDRYEIFLRQVFDEARHLHSVTFKMLLVLLL